MKIILAVNVEEAVRFVSGHKLDPVDYVIVYDPSSLQGLRFRYEDVVRVPGWSRRSDIEVIEDWILRTHVACSLPSAYGKSGKTDGPFGNV